MPSLIICSAFILVIAFASLCIAWVCAWVPFKICSSVLKNPTWYLMGSEFSCDVRLNSSDTTTSLSTLRSYHEFNFAFIPTCMIAICWQFLVLPSTQCWEFLVEVPNSEIPLLLSLNSQRYHVWYDIDTKDAYEYKLRRLKCFKN